MHQGENLIPGIEATVLACPGQTQEVPDVVCFLRSRRVHHPSLATVRTLSFQPSHKASQAKGDSATIALSLGAAGERNVPLATRVREKSPYERVKIAQEAGEAQRDERHNAGSEAEKKGSSTIGHSWNQCQ